MTGENAEPSKQMAEGIRLQDQKTGKPKVGVVKLRIGSKKGYFKGKWESGHSSSDGLASLVSG
jgi:hypothetical protein